MFSYFELVGLIIVLGIVGCMVLILFSLMMLEHESEKLAHG